MSTVYVVLGFPESREMTNAGDNSRELKILNKRLVSRECQVERKCLVVEPVL